MQTLAYNGKHNAKVTISYALVLSHWKDSDPVLYSGWLLSMIDRILRVRCESWISDMIHFGVRPCEHCVYSNWLCLILGFQRKSSFVFINIVYNVFHNPIRITSIHYTLNRNNSEREKLNMRFPKTPIKFDVLKNKKQ